MVQEEPTRWYPYEPMTDGGRATARPNGLTPVRVVASPRRRSTVSARLVDGVIELRVPAWMPLAVAMPA